MTAIEDRLAAAGRALRTQADHDVDVAGALAGVVGGAETPGAPVRAPSRRVLALAAAVVLVVGVIAAGTVLGDDAADDVLVAGEGTPGATADHTPAPTDPAPDPVEDPTPPPDRLVTFDGVGDVRLGDPLPPEDVDRFEGSSCGYWGPIEPSHDGDEPLGGLVSGADTATPTVATVMVRDNPRYLTAQGAGVGSLLVDLEAAYGDELVVDRAGGAGLPTDGLLAIYQDVAAIRSEAGAITFYLLDDVVQAVKVSAPDAWGDDEGCA